MYGFQISTVGNTPSMQLRGGSQQLFLDEIPADASMISSIPVSDVAYIKVLRPPFMGSSGGGANGAIAIYTRRFMFIIAPKGKKFPAKVGMMLPSELDVLSLKQGINRIFPAARKALRNWL